MCLAVQKSMQDDERVLAYAGRRAENCGFCGTKWLGSASGRRAESASDAHFTLCLTFLISPVELYYMAVLCKRLWIGSIGSIAEYVSVSCRRPRPRIVCTASVMQQRCARLTRRTVVQLHRSRTEPIHSQSGILIGADHVMSGIPPPAVSLGLNLT